MWVCVGDSGLFRFDFVLFWLCIVGGWSEIFGEIKGCCFGF